jgi:hypothetical protein
MPDLSATLVFAATAGNFSLVRERVEAGADLSYSDPQKGTSLYAGIRSAQCVAYLLSHGADPNYFHRESGHTVLDHALSMIHYYTAQSAFLIHRAGGIPKTYSILSPPCADSMVCGRLTVAFPDGWFRYYTLGQVCYGEITAHNQEWCFDCTSHSTAGHFFRIEALYCPDRLNLQSIERTDEGFVLVDLRGRKHPWTGDPTEVQLQATISLL